MDYNCCSDYYCCYIPILINVLHFTITIALATHDNIVIGQSGSSNNNDNNNNDSNNDSNNDNNNNDDDSNNSDD